MTKRLLLLLAYLAFGAVYGFGSWISYPPYNGDGKPFGVWESITVHAFMWPIILALDLGYQSARNDAERHGLNEESPL